jgi:hypothetical protein
MSFNEMFDKIIRRKVSEAESDFPFDEANWQNMNRMMDAERGSSGLGKTSKLFLLFGSLFFVIATISFFSLLNSTGEKNNIAEKTTSPINNANVLNKADQPLAVKSENIDQDANTSASESNNSNELNPDSHGSNVNTGGENSDSKTIDAANNTASVVSKNGIAENGNNDVVKNAKGSDKLADINGGNDNSAEKSATGKTNVKNEGHGTKQNNSGSRPKNISVNGNGKMTADIKQVLGSATKNPENKKSKTYGSQKGKISKEKIEIQPDQEVLVSAVTTADEKENSDNLLEMRSSILQIWKKDAVLKTSAYDFIRLDDEYFKRNRRKTHFMNVEAGTTYLFGWETANGRDAKGFNAFGGINYGVYLSKKTSISAGFQLYNVGNIKQAFYTKSNLDYDFGSTGNFTNITANTLYYFSIPVKAYYKIGKNRVGLGINAGFLFNGKNTIETYSEADNVKRNVVLTKNTGYYEGLNKTNILVSAFYTQSIYRRIKLNGEVIYGLSDTYNNSAKSSTFERNIGLKLSLQYTLFDK